MILPKIPQQKFVRTDFILISFLLNVFIFCSFPQGFDSESKFNPNEADMVIAVCEYLLRQGYSAEDITILSTYLEHDRYIKKVKKLCLNPVHHWIMCKFPVHDYFTFYQIIDKKRSPKWAGLMTTVVDNYQGEENTIVLLSLVRSNPFGSVGFLSIKNRYSRQSGHPWVQWPLYRFYFFGKPASLLSITFSPLYS